MQLCFKIGYGNSQSPTLTTTTSPTTTPSPSCGGQHNDKEKQEDCETVSSYDNYRDGCESESESEINDRKINNENYALCASIKTCL